MVGIKTLWQRDHGICHLCGDPVPQPIGRRRRLGNHPLAASRDHVVPKVEGGTGSQDNLRLAHRWCNSRRMDMPVDKFQQVVQDATKAAMKSVSKRKVEMQTEAQKRRERRDAILRMMQNATEA